MIPLPVILSQAKDWDYPRFVDLGRSGFQLVLFSKSTGER